VPTRELALQVRIFHFLFSQNFANKFPKVSAVIRDLAKYIPDLQCMVSTGGTSFQEDIFRLQNTVHILVGTPGRVLDLCHKNVAKLNNAETLVLDEADKLLSIDFQPIIEGIIKYCNLDRQLMLFSATFPITVLDFKNKYIKDA